MNEMSTNRQRIEMKIFIIRNFAKSTNNKRTHEKKMRKRRVFRLSSCLRINHRCIAQKRRVKRSETYERKEENQEEKVIFYAQFCPLTHKNENICAMKLFC